MRRSSHQCSSPARGRRKGRSARTPERFCSANERAHVPAGNTGNAGAARREGYCARAGGVLFPSWRIGLQQCTPIFDVGDPHVASRKSLRKVEEISTVLSGLLGGI